MTRHEYSNALGQMMNSGHYWVEDGIAGVIMPEVVNGGLYLPGVATPLHHTTIRRIGGQVGDMRIGMVCRAVLSPTSNLDIIRDECGSVTQWLRRIIRCYRGGVTAREVADVLGVSTSSVSGILTTLFHERYTFRTRTRREVQRVSAEGRILSAGTVNVFGDFVRMFDRSNVVAHQPDFFSLSARDRAVPGDLPGEIPEVPDEEVPPAETDSIHPTFEEIVDAGEAEAGADSGTLNLDQILASTDLVPGRGQLDTNEVARAIQPAIRGQVTVGELAALLTRAVEEGELTATQALEIAHLLDIDATEAEVEEFAKKPPKPVEPHFPPDTGVYRDEICVD